MGWGIYKHSAAREKGHEGRQNAFFRNAWLTDDIHFHRRIGSRSQMSRSGKHRAVLGTSWKSWRGRWSAPSSLWILGGVMRVRGTRGGRGEDEDGKDCRCRGFGSVTRVVAVKTKKKDKWLRFTLPTAASTFDPRHFLSFECSVRATACTWNAGRAWSLHQGDALSPCPPLVCSSPSFFAYQTTNDPMTNLRVAVNEIRYERFQSNPKTPQTQKEKRLTTFVNHVQTRAKPARHAPPPGEAVTPCCVGGCRPALAFVSHIMAFNQ